MAKTQDNPTTIKGIQQSKTVVIPTLIWKASAEAGGIPQLWKTAANKTTLAKKANHKRAPGNIRQS